MNLIKLIFVTSILFFVFCTDIKAQSEPILYFCSKFDKVESGIGDRFYTGPLIVVVRCDRELGASKVTIQLEKYNGTGFDIYTTVKFNIKSTVKYTWFENYELRADDPGIYRCFLLDENKNTIASGLVELIKQ
jgi:hypothetical protein